MRSIFRTACLIIGVLAFVFALNEFASLVFDTGGNFIRFIILAGTSALAFIMLILMYNVESYPARERELLLEEQLEREARRQLGIR